MKKFIISAGFLIAFAAYGLYQFFGGTKTLSYAAQTSTPVEQVPQLQKQTPTTAVPKVKTTGQYVDGVYTGSLSDAYYGNVQVRVTVTSGKIANVAFLQYPSDRSTSREINARATTMLTQEAIQAQSANVNTISGASATSDAFRQSLSSALVQAKA